MSVNISDIDDTMGEEISTETRALEEVLNSFMYYSTFGKDKILGMIKQMRNIPQEHQIIIGGQFKAHINNVRDRIEKNQEVLKMIVNNGMGVFGDKFNKAVRIHQDRRPTNDFLSKVFSTMRQICREWSNEGTPERTATFQPIIDEINRLYPKESVKRSEIKIFVPGCGLGRLPHELIEEGYSVQGNEFSFFMLLTSFFILNTCKKVDEHTIYPYIFDRSNSWTYEDQTRGISFPDKLLSKDNLVRRNSFSMCAGDFLEVTRDATFNVIATAWFLDTAHNVIDYIEGIHRSLDEEGVWINVGPLTWHYEDVQNELSIELPYSEVMRIIKEKGFEVINEMRIDSKYTVNRNSMLQNQYTCAYFAARKKKTD